jgi:hypothetical protein
MITNDGCPAFADHDLCKCALFMDRKYDDWNGILTRQRNRCYIHDGKPLVEHLVMGDVFKADGVREFLRIGRIDAIDLRALEDRLAPISASPAASRRNRW